MATVSNDRYRFTYTIITNDTNVVATFTKLEYYSTYSGKTRINSQTSQIFYRDSSGTSAETGISIATIEFTGTGWKTIWTGTKEVTSYRQTTITTIATNAGTIEVPVLPSVQVTYNTDGGSSAPDTQLKYLGKNLRLSTVKPTKLGYTFVNWRSSSDGELYLPGSTYLLDQATTMTAQWTAATYTVSYKTNGGSGVANPQTKTYNVALNFNDGSTIYRKDIVSQITQEYELLRWNTNPDDTGVSYSLGSEIPNITNDLTVYAIWQLKYLYPFVGNLQSYRTATSNISDKTRSDTGQYIYISFDFIGCSVDAGATYHLPNCKIHIDDDVYTPTLSFTSSPNGSLEFKSSTQYGLDNPHNIIIELFDPQHTSSSFLAYDYITTGIYPIDLYDNGLTNEVYMGIMHPYIASVPLTLADTYVDGNVDVKLDIDPNASSVIPATSGEDKDLFNKIVDNGWYNDVISNNNVLLLKQWANKVSDVQSPGPTPPTPTPTSDYYKEVFVDEVYTNSTSDTNTVFTNALLGIVQNYPDMEYTVFKGTFYKTYSGVSTRYYGWYEVLILDTNDIDETYSGLPKWFLGTAYCWTSDIIKFYNGTNSTTGQTNVIATNMFQINTGSYANFTYETGFTYYATSGEECPTMTRRAGIVTLSGAIKTTAAQSTTGKKKMARLPYGYRPHKELHFLSQGSGVNRYLLYVDTDGYLWADRYGTTSEIALPNGVWLNISCTYICYNL